MMFQAFFSPAFQAAPTEPKSLVLMENDGESQPGFVSHFDILSDRPFSTSPAALSVAAPVFWMATVWRGCPPDLATSAPTTTPISPIRMSGTTLRVAKVFSLPMLRAPSWRPVQGARVVLTLAVAAEHRSEIPDNTTVARSSHRSLGRLFGRIREPHSADCGSDEPDQDSRLQSGWPEAYGWPRPVPPVS
jgi:hypothetical protein